MLCIEDKDFNNAWARAVRAVLRDGVSMTIGNQIEPKPIKDMSNTVIELTGNAIKQIENREIHEKFPFKLINQYCDEFTPEFQEKFMDAAAETVGFAYTYYDRLTRRTDVDQLRTLRDGLSNQLISGISSNRNQAITWVPGIDAGHPTSPCLQRIWVRLIKDRDVEVHLTWRSRDLFTAWQANIIAIVNMLNRDVIEPNGCRIVKLVDFSNSLHIYNSDAAEATGVKLVAVSPVGN